MDQISQDLVDVMKVDWVASMVRKLIQHGIPADQAAVIFRRANEFEDGWADSAGTDHPVRLSDEEMSVAITRAQDDDYWQLR